MPGMTVQGRDRHDEDPVIRVGFTCSKKVGNAVARNRAKRRLRAVARELLQEAGQEQPEVGNDERERDTDEIPG